MAPPLAGVRVLDLSRVLAGPYCSMLLADLGASVTKVERPAGGDETRTWGPPFVEGEAAYFLSVNRGKRSVALELGAEGTRTAVERLARDADVVIENFKTGGADRLGVGYEAIRALNAAVVYCSISGFGSARSPSGRPGYDFVAQAESGLMSITGDTVGAPSKVGVALLDVLAGLNAAVAILAALRRREQGGGGEHVEVSLLDSGLGALVNVAQNALVTGIEPERLGNAHPNIAPYQTFRTSDGHLAVAAANDALFVRMCQAIGREDLLADKRFARNSARVEHREQLAAALERTFAARTAEHWIRTLGAVGVPVGRIRGVLEAIRAAGAAGDPATFTVDHPTVGPLELLRPVARLRNTIGASDSLPPPLLGEHTRAVLQDVGLRDEELEALLSGGLAAEPVAPLTG